MEGQQHHKDEYSLQQILRLVAPLTGYLLRRWWLFLIVGILFGGYGYLRAYFAKPLYKGSLTFLLSGESKAPAGGLTGILLDLNGGGGGSSVSDVFKGETLIDYMNSFRVIKRVLFQPVKSADSVFVNYFVKDIKLDQKWEADPYLAGQFPFPSSVDRVTPVQDSLLREVREILTNDFLEIARPGKKLSFYEASTTYHNELVATKLPRIWLDETARLYIETKTKQAQDNLNMLKHEVDTLGRALSGGISNVASSIDMTYNLNPAFQSTRSPAQRQQVNVSALTAAYTEAFRNYELAKITLQKETPLFQIIDEPAMPLKRIKGGRIIAGAKLAFIADFLLLVVLLGMFTVKSIKKNKTITAGA